MALQYSFSDDLRHAIGTGIHGDDETQVRHDVEPLATITEPANPAHAFAIDLRSRRLHAVVRRRSRRSRSNNGKVGYLVVSFAANT